MAGCPLPILKKRPVCRFNTLLCPYGLNRRGLEIKESTTMHCFTSFCPLWAGPTWVDNKKKQHLFLKTKKQQQALFVFLRRRDCPYSHEF
jgi:hypothetical protein